MDFGSIVQGSSPCVPASRKKRPVLGSQAVLTHALVSPVQLQLEEDEQEVPFLT